MQTPHFALSEARAADSARVFAFKTLDTSGFGLYNAAHV